MNSLEKLKSNLIALELEEKEEELPFSKDKIEIISDSVQQALKIAADKLKASIEHLDYEILQKGNKGFLGFGRFPYRILISKIDQGHDANFSDIEDWNVNLNKEEDKSILKDESDLNKDGKARLRMYRKGIFLTIMPPKGSGIPIDIHSVLDKIKYSGITEFDQKLVEKTVKQKEGRPIKIGRWDPKPNADSTLAMEVSEDHMQAIINIRPPRPGGCHLEVNEIILTLEKNGVIFGIRKESIQEALDEDKYGSQIVAAEGKIPQDGKDGYIDYKVKIKKNLEFKEDSQGRVNFLERELPENVVQGQIIAEIKPPEKGINGTTVFSKVLPSKDGDKIDLKLGKGTILSDDQTKLIAQQNGQITFVGEKINVENVYTVTGDVGLHTGNISFLGSVIVRGSVQDNSSIKAIGNIQIGGNVQKAQLEAEGDVIIRGGVQGRNEASIESTNGDVLAKFIQNVTVKAEKNIVIEEAIVYSKVQAVEKVICQGKRGQIVGGEVIAGQEVRVKQLGAHASPVTKIVVGLNPKVLNQQRELEKSEAHILEEISQIELSIKTLQTQKKFNKEGLSSEKEELLVRSLDQKDKFKQRLDEISQEKEELEDHVSDQSTSGAVHIEKTLYPGVTIQVNHATFTAKDEYTNVTLIEKKGNIKIVPYREEKIKKNWRERSLNER